MKSTPRFRGPSLILLATVHILLFAAGLAAAAALRQGASFVTPFAPAEALRSFFTQNPAAVRVSNFFLFGSAVPLGIFAVTAVSRLRNMGVRAAGTNIALLGGLTATIALLLSGIVGWVLSVPEVSSSAPVVKAIDFLNFLLGGVFYAVGFGLLAAGVSVTSYFTRLLPRWLVALGMVVALAGELSSFSLIACQANFFIPITRFVGFIWMLSVAVALTKDRKAAQAANVGDFAVVLHDSAGIALTVAVLVSSLALVEGLRATFANTGNPLQILVLRKGSNSELGSSVTRESFALLRTMSGIARDSSNEPMVSLEMTQVINLPSVDDPKGMNVTLRGLLPTGIGMRNVHLAAGRWFQVGHREIVVGKSIAQRYPDAQFGHHLHFGRGDWQIVGIMDGGESAVNSEIWGDLNQVSSDYNREDNLSSILVRASDAVAVSALIKVIDDDRQLNLYGIREPAYYASQTSSGAPLEFLGILVAIIMAIGSRFAAMNTMYAAVSRRSQEIGTLRVLGFSRARILVSFLIEALLLSIAGGILGCLITLPLNGVTTGVGNFFTFSEIAFHFHVGLSTMTIGVAFAAIVGVLGGFFPARSAAKKEILGALHEA